MIVHATCVDIAGAGVLILGLSGSGKSDLGLRLIAEGALLVSDDQTVLQRSGVYWLARAPEKIAGIAEVRGAGILVMPQKAQTLLRLAVRLGHADVDRLPETAYWRPDDAHVPRLPLLLLDGREASAPAKVRISLASLFRGGAREVGEVPSVVEQTREEDY